jgi:hypothetical protein
MGIYSLLEPMHNFNIGNFDELFEAKDKAQEHFENLLMQYLQEVQDKNHLDIHYHANEWIKNIHEIEIARERLIRETPRGKRTCPPQLCFSPTVHLKTYVLVSLSLSVCCLCLCVFVYIYMFIYTRRCKWPTNCLAVLSASI